MGRIVNALLVTPDPNQSQAAWFVAVAMIDRLSECPAASEVWEGLKQKTGFRRHE